MKAVLHTEEYLNIQVLKKLFSHEIIVLILIENLIKLNFSNTYKIGTPFIILSLKLRKRWTKLKEVERKQN